MPLWLQIITAIITALPKLVSWILELVDKFKKPEPTDAPVAMLSAEQNHTLFVSSMSTLAQGGIDALTQIKAKLDERAAALAPPPAA